MRTERYYVHTCALKVLLNDKHIQFVIFVSVYVFTLYLEYKLAIEQQ